MKKYLYILLSLIVILAAVLFVKVKAQQCNQDCQTANGGPVVGFNSSYTCSDPNHPEYCYLSTMSGITVDSTGGLHLRLNQIGANFVPSNNYPVSTNWRMTGAAADFNGDGYVDLAEGGRQCDDHNYVSGDTNLSIFFSQGKDLPSNPTRFRFLGPYYINYLSTFTTYEIMALGAGDYDGDGDADIAALSWQGRLWIFWNRFVEDHRAVGYANSNLFSATPTPIAASPNNDLINDGYGEFGSSSSHFRWEGNIASADVNGDSKLDLIVGIPTRWATSRWGEVVIYINNGSGTFSRKNNPVINPSPPPTNIPCNPYPNNDTYLYGVCGVAAGKFRGSSQPVDFLVGTAGGPSSNPTAVYYYRNDGLGNFTLDTGTGGRSFSLQASRGTLSFFGAGDLENDGSPDLVLSTDGAHYGWQGGYVYWYENQIDPVTHQPTGHFTMNCVPTSCARVSSSGDLDSGALGDFDYDGDLDFFVADGNNSLNVYFFMNETLPLYINTGTVDSKNRIGCDFITSENAIVAATLTHSASIPSGTSITYYLSNSDDENGNPKWEGPVTPGTEFCFESPGVFLRWRAVLTTQPPPNNTATPRIYWVTLNYRYITKREYSRTSHAFTMAEVDLNHQGDDEVLYAASFEFPTWKGHLRSWNVTDLNLAADRSSQLREIKTAGADFIADAGELLRTRDWSSRNVFTAYDNSGDGIMNDRLDFNVSNWATLDEFLGVGVGDPNVVQPLIRFVLGDTRNWKLGDINHSSPQSLEPPSDSEYLMGDAVGYKAFKEAYKNRTHVIFAGANDGMLHCFDPVTMVEKWAFIPHNLLYKLYKMRVTDPDCGIFLYHNFFVDGTPAIHDVYFNSDSAWHTILVCGQGAGWGYNHDWYYFALDVTDPEVPRPLWEFTAHNSMGETWSVPAIGRMASDSNWVAFFGSGYDNDIDRVLGNHFYAVDVENGALIKDMAISETPEPVSPFGIQNTLPGSPALALNHDGFVSGVYFGDLLGRIWKIDVTGDAQHWSPLVIYKDPYKYPIITKPALAVNQTDQSVHLYFGTGGDEKAPSAPTSVYYSFIALRDVNSIISVDWYIGTDALANLSAYPHFSATLKKDTFGQGEKVWADPVIADNLVYIATLNGSIESLNPCKTVAGSGKIYARYTLGQSVGGSALVGIGGETIASLATLQKVRSAVTIGKTQSVDVQGQAPVVKRKVFIQSYTQPGGVGEPPSEVLAQPVPPTKILIKNWREVYKVVR
jgi:hypothetical protein